MSEVQIPQEIRSLADKLKAEFKLSSAGVVEVPADLYESTLAEADLDLKTVKKVQDHNSNMVSATGLALGEIGMEAMKKDKKLDQVSVSFKAGKDTHSAVFQRSKEVPVNAPGEPRKTALKYGMLRSSVTVHGAGNKGSLKRVRTHLNAQAEKILGK